MNIGKYIFAQVIDFIPRYQFDKLVKKLEFDSSNGKIGRWVHKK